MNRKNIAAVFVAAAMLLMPCKAEVFSQQQLLPAGHWVYDAMTALYGQMGKVSMFDTPPISVEEIKMYLRDVDYESLSDAGKTLYDNVKDYLNEKAFGFEGEGVFIGANAWLHPAVMAKTNGDVDWSSSTTYCDPKGYTTINTYEAGDEFTQTMSLFPIYCGFGDAVALETRFYFGRVPGDIVNEKYITTNIPSGSSNNGFTDAKMAYACAGHSWDKWGFSFKIMKDGMQVGRTAAGSIIYNSTFLTDGLMQLSVWSKKVNYNLDLIQVERKTFMYIHDVKVSPWKWLKIGFLEGTLINGPFEMRFLNPLMMMHGFSGSTEYVKDRPAIEQQIYDQADFCAYIGVTAEVVPCKNLRIYAMWAQNEMQTPAELDSDEARTYPDSLGLQLGGEYTLPWKEGFWTFALEGLYTTPFCYLKQHKECSLAVEKKDVMTWIGTPFGPDCISCVAKAQYKQPGKWSCGAQYTFAAHGENSFGLFNQRTKYDGTWYDAFYPAVRYNLGDKAEEYGLSYDDAHDMARTYKLTGTIQYTNTLVLNGSYEFNKHFSVNGAMAATFVFNNYNQGGESAAGAEVLLGGTWKIF